MSKHFCDFPKPTSLSDWSAVQRWERALTLNISLLFFHLLHICGTFHVYNWVWNNNVAKRKTSSKRKFGLWATFYLEPSSSQHITLSLHMTVIDECINIQLSTWWIYSCASRYVNILHVCTPKLWWMREWHAQMWYRCAWIGSLAHDISACNGCV